MDVDPRVGHADLAAVPLDAVHGFLHGSLEIRVWEDHGWRLSAEFEDDVLEVRLGGCGLDEASCSS